ncbi:MAG TPA: IS110 family transposase, partial [Sedimenticola sp.]|nr:IS110 family transposase [Sedimenticola sp.]
MAMPVRPLLIGIDVSKKTLDICIDSDESTRSIPNERQAIASWIKSLPDGPVEIALEATNTFHRALCEQAFKARHTIYLIDGYRLSRYREGVGIRAKNDASDARLLCRYLTNERDALRPWSPPPKAYTALLALLSRRAVLVQARARLRQSLAEIPGIKRQSQA